MLALAPDLVTVTRLEPGYTGPLDDPATALFFDEGVAALAANGVLGDPRGSTADAGRAYLASLHDAIERQLNEFASPEQRGRRAGRNG